MSDKEWLDSLKASDEIAMRDGFGYAKYSLGVVTRRDKVKIVVKPSDGSRDQVFSAKSGRIPGEQSAYSRRGIEPVTDTIRATVRRDALLKRVENASWHKLTTETLQSICDTLSAAPSLQASQP
jgi:hypothetical protein